MKNVATLASAAAVIATAPQVSAKAMSQASIVIHAPLQTVWRLVVDVDRWPKWNSAVESAHLDGVLEDGAIFDWKSGGLGIRSTVREIDPMRRLVWTGKTIGTSAVHSWTFEATERGVEVTTSETFDGWLPSLMPRTMQKKLDETLPALLASLKAAAERA
jgi:uncharacterized protein YndB with AHSA1/START domain